MINAVIRNIFIVIEINASLAIHFSVMMLKKNIQVRELAIYKYNFSSSKSIASLSFHKKCGIRLAYLKLSLHL